MKPMLPLPERWELRCPRSLQEAMEWGWPRHKDIPTVPPTYTKRNWWPWVALALLVALVLK